jgi:hypothetical protein
MAPTFAARPGVAYGVVGAVFLVLVAWGPIPALQRWLPILILAGILAGAMIALQRSLGDEFPPEGGAYAAR